MTDDEIHLLERRYTLHVYGDFVQILNSANTKRYVKVGQPIDFPVKKTYYRIAPAIAELWATKYSDRISVWQFLLLRNTFKRSRIKLTVENFDKFLNSGLNNGTSDV